MDALAQNLGIKNVQAKDAKTHYTVDDGRGTRSVVFDDVITKWMQGLYELLKHIAGARESRHVILPDEAVESEYPGNIAPRNQFFFLAETVCNQLMYHLIKNELSGSEANRNLHYLSYHVVFSGANFSPDTAELEFLTLQKYLKRLVTEAFNGFLQADFFDFYISYWSLFEACITATSRDYEERIQEKCNESQFRKMEKLIRAIYSKSGDKDTEEIVRIFRESKEEYLKKFPKYVSFNDRRDYLLDSVIKNYSRDKKKDRKTLEFCARLRNTLHNNGLHHGADATLEIGGQTFSLCTMALMYLSSFSNYFILAREIFDIYTAIVDGLEQSEARDN